MSGGSYDYLYRKMEEAALRLLSKDQPLYRQAFGDLLIRCSNAMHEIEWVDSNDKSEGDDEEAIMNCITHNDILDFSIEIAMGIIEELEELIEKAKEIKK